MWLFQEMQAKKYKSLYSKHLNIKYLYQLFVRILPFMMVVLVVHPVANLAICYYSGRTDGEVHQFCITQTMRITDLV